MFIYSVTNLKDENKKYIGISIIPIDDRKWYHAEETKRIISILKSEALSKLHTLDSFSKLAQAFIEYSVDSFKWEIVESHTNAETLCKRQKYFITLHDSFHNGYNNFAGLKDISVFHKGEKELNLDGYFKSEDVSGEKNVNAKLSYDDIHEVKKLLSIGKRSQTKIAKQFNVSLSTIKRINKQMKLIDDEYSQSPINPPITKPKTSVRGFTNEEVDSIHKHILSGQHTKKELQDLLNLSEHALKTFIKELKADGHTFKFKVPYAALTDKQAKEIKMLIYAGSMSQNAIAKEFGVSKMVISSIRKGITYNHITI